MSTVSHILSRAEVCTAVMHEHGLYLPGSLRVHLPASVLALLPSQERDQVGLAAAIIGARVEPLSVQWPFYRTTPLSASISLCRATVTQLSKLCVFCRAIKTTSFDTGARTAIMLGLGMEHRSTDPKELTPLSEFEWTELLYRADLQPDQPSEVSSEAKARLLMLAS